jgi:uncharacterized membrane protein
MIIIRSCVAATAAFLVLFICARFFAPKFLNNAFFDWGLLLACALSPLLSAYLRSKSVILIVFLVVGLALLFFILAFIIMAKLFNEGL